MANRKSNKIQLKIDVRSYRELSPYAFLSDTTIAFILDNYFSCIGNFQHDKFSNKAIANLEKVIHCKNIYDSTQKENINIYPKIIGILQDSITQNTFKFSSTIESKLFNPIEIIRNQQKLLISFTSFLISRMKNALSEMPIPRNSFPCFISRNSSLHLETSNNNNTDNEDETNVNYLLDQIMMDIHNDRKNEIDFLVYQNDVTQLFETFAKYNDSFTFSPIFICSYLKKFDQILNCLSSSLNHEDSNSSENLKCFIMMIFIKMRIYMQVYDLHGFLQILIQIFNILNDHPELDISSFASLEITVQDLLPKCTSPCSLIIQNISNETFLDFCFSHDGQNDFILTKKSIFKVKPTNKEDIIEINLNNVIPVAFKSGDYLDIQKILSKSEKEKVKIAFSDGVLYLISLEEQIIYRVRVCPEEEYVRKKEKLIKKIENAKEHLHQQPSKEKAVKKNKKPTINDILKEERMEQKRRRKADKYKEDEFEEDLAKIQISISNHPIISMSAYNNYIRIIQRESYMNKTTTLIFTNVDLMPYCRMNYNIEKAFKKQEDERISIQTQIKIKLENKNQEIKIKDVFFSCDYMFISFEDSSIDQYIIYNNGTIELVKQFFSPLISFPHSIMKMDNDMFLYYCEPISNDGTGGISITKMYLPETKYWLREDNSLFLKYPYLKNLSNIVNNCSQFILNRKIVTPFTIDEYNGKENSTDCSIGLKVTPKEMGLLIQSPNSIASLLPKIKEMFFEMIDDDLIQILAPLLIKLIGINFLYEMNQYDNYHKISENAIDIFSTFKDFLLDIFSSFYHSYSIEFDIILGESILFTISICGKFLFYPNSYNELHDLMSQILCDNYNYYSKLMLKSFSSLLFSYPSSLYLLDQSIYEQLVSFGDEINIHELFFKSLLFVFIEIMFATNDSKFIECISPYIHILFKHIKYIINDESIPLTIAEQLLSYLFSYESSNVYFSLMIQKELIEISNDLFKRISSIPSVVESDKEFLKNNNDFKGQEIRKETKIIESEHPYNKESLNDEILVNNKSLIEDIGIINFDSDVDEILIKFDHRCKLKENDEFILSTKESNPIYIGGKNKIEFNSFYKLKTNYVKISIVRKNNDFIKDGTAFWGYKISFTGISYNTSFYWKPNSHLFFYNNFVSFIIKLYSHAYSSIQVEEFEKNISFLVDEKIIQGIKFDESKQIDEAMVIKGIGHDNELKKNFLIDLITVKDNHSQIHDFLDLMYSKTAKFNRMHLSDSSEKINEDELYLAACLLKQLDLISLCINLMEKINSNSDFEIPNSILLVWKRIYALRKALIFENQQSKSSATNDYERYLEDVKNKCMLLLYSDPILNHDDKDINDDIIELKIKEIYSFVTSKITLQQIFDFINIRERRLMISSQSISLLHSFLNQKTLFESSKLVLAFSVSGTSPLKNCFGVSKHKLDEYSKLSCSLTISFIENIFKHPLNAMICKTSFMKHFLYDHGDNDTMIKCSKIFIEMLNNNQIDKDSFLYNRLNFVLILMLLGLVSTTRNEEIINYIISMLSLDNDDIESKQLILTTIPFLSKLFSENCQLQNEELIFSILENNRKCPIIVKSIFYWIAAVMNDKSNHDDFILKVLKGIGQSLTGQPCLFIDDSFQTITHRQVSESMISFIVILFNNQNDSLFAAIHNILSHKIDENLKEDEMFILIGLFASIGQSVSSGLDNYRSNSIVADPSKLNLNENEIQSLLIINDCIINSKYFKNDEINENEMDQKEVAQNVLISAFYTFVPIIMQNKNNIDILLNKCDVKQVLSLLEISRNSLPSNENSIQVLFHHLGQAIIGSLYNGNALNYENSLNFIKMNYGEIIYDKSNDVIKSDMNHLNIFTSNRPFDSNCETYFEIKIRKIGLKNIFIGIIDSEESNYNKATGFGCFGHTNIFCRKSPFLSNDLSIVADEVMDYDLVRIKEGTLIGFYYTPNFLHMMLNGNMIPYRISLKSLKSYIPIIIIDHDEVELEITSNISVVDHSDKKYDFLDLNNFAEQYFDIKDIFVSDQNKKEKANYCNFIKNKQFLIGEKIKVDQDDQEGIIKEIYPNNESDSFIKVKVETFNESTLSTEIIDTEIDIREKIDLKTNYFNLIENRTNTKFGFNSSFDLTSLPRHIQVCPDLNKVKRYIKNKTIKNNSKSIAIIMMRYFTFILVDYLRYSKSKYLLEEGIETNEARSIIKSLAYSLPTITLFNPLFQNSLDEYNMNENLIFTEQKDDFVIKIPGSSVSFHNSFIAFLQKQEDFLSPQFLSILIQDLYEIVIQKDSMSLSFLYNSISSMNKIESIVSLPAKFKYKTKIKTDELQNYIGYVPILLSSIPKQLPSCFCDGRRYRMKSNEISFFVPSSFILDIFLKWKYDFEKIEYIDIPTDFKLQFGLYILSTNLQEDLLSGQLGFIQIVFILIQACKNIKILVPKILEQIITLSLKKDVLSYPFLKDILTYLISQNEFTDDLFNKKTSVSFSILQKKSQNYYIDEFPTYKNEGPVIFNIFLTLFQAKAAELTNDPSLIFEQYYRINEELFKIFDERNTDHIEGSLKKDNASTSKTKKKNSHLLYLLYYYSLLLNNKDDNGPYPKFLFAHDWMKQHFGGFAKTITTKEIAKAKINNESSSNELYESDVINNDIDLQCSYVFSNIYENERNDEQYQVTIRQIYDDIDIELPKNGQKNSISFPIVIEIMGNKQFKDGDIFVVSFEPSKEQQKKYFIDHFKEFENSFQKFIFYQKYDNEISKSAFNIRSREHNHYSNHGGPLGIDLGTTFSSISIHESSVRPTIIRDNHNLNQINNSNTETQSIDDNSDFDFNTESSSDDDLNHYLNTEIQNLYDSIEHDHDSDSQAQNVNENHEIDSQAQNNVDDNHEIDSQAQNVNDNHEIDSTVTTFDHHSGFVQFGAADFQPLEDDYIYDDFEMQTENDDSENENQSETQIENTNNDNHSINYYASVLEMIHNSSSNYNNNSNNNNSNNNNNNSNNNDDNDTVLIGGHSYLRIFPLLSRIRFPDSIVGTSSLISIHSDIENEFDLFNIYNQIPLESSIQLQIPSIDDNIVSLRSSAFSCFILIIKEMMSTYSKTTEYSSIWNIPLSNGNKNFYMNQIIRPICSLGTEAKFRFISNIYLNEKRGEPKLKIQFNRFEQRKFIEMNKDSSATIARPLLIQLMEQVDIQSLHLLKVNKNAPFKVILAGENAIDLGGPAREIFSCLIEEIMNKSLGIFSFNPNRRHKNKETNQEDLILCTNDNLKYFSCYVNEKLFSNRFVYAGSLIAICIVSNLPQPMKLSSVIWEYLSGNEVSIESIYEIDEDFKKFIENAENIQAKLANLNEDEFQSLFIHNFTINDSFDNIVELVQSGSSKLVKKDDLYKFIQLSKEFRIHEFDCQLKELKKGFDIVMTIKNITSILRPDELKLLVCGEPNCDIEQMKKMIVVSCIRNEKKIQEMFWNVMNHFSIKERLSFIRFASGNLGLPAPGLKWDENIKVTVKPFRNNTEKLMHASTCSSAVTIPFFESEDELKKIMKISMDNSGIITDSKENLESIVEFL